MIERGTWSGEASSGQWLDALLGWWRWLTFVLQREHQDALDATDVEQIEPKRACAGDIQAFRRVAVGQAQQLVTLAQLGTRESREGLRQGHRAGRARPC
jgi:hypothetical protein